MALNIAQKFKTLVTGGSIATASIATVVPFSDAVAGDRQKTSYTRQYSAGHPALSAPRYSREHPTTPSIAVYIGKDSPQTPEQWKSYLEEIFAKYNHTVEVFAIDQKDLNQTVFDSYVSGLEVEGDFRNTKEGIKSLFVKTIEAKKVAASSAIRFKGRH